MAVWLCQRHGNTLFIGKDDEGNPIHISIYKDHMFIWNDGQMPENMRTTECLFASILPSPSILNYHVFISSGMIEA